MRRTKPKICPKCGSSEVVPIVYGYPLESLLKAAEKGRVELGGCCITGDDPNFRCKTCGKAFRK